MIAAGPAVMVVVALLAVVLRPSGHGSSGQAQAVPGDSRAVDLAATDTTSSAPAPQSSAVVQPSASAVAPPPATTSMTSNRPKPSPTSRYVGPGGISVQAPAGWRNDASAGVPSIRDYDAPDSPARLLGQYFRIGIGNPTPDDDFDNEIVQSVNFLQQTYQAQIVQPPRFQVFRGVRSADIEYLYSIQSLGVVRHGVERLWQEGGVTLILQSSGPAARWAASQAVFKQLVATVAVS